MISEPFDITNGIKQGSWLVQYLFLFHATVLDDETWCLDIGVRICFRSSRKVFNLSKMRRGRQVAEQIVGELYADDYAPEAHSEDDIQLITNRFVKSAENYGQQISWLAFKRHRLCGSQCRQTLRHADRKQPVLLLSKNQTALRDCKPPPRRLTATKSDPGFESGFQD